MGGTMVIPNTQTPKRYGENLQAPPPKRLRTSESDQEAPGRHCKPFHNFAYSREQTAPLDYVVAVTNAMAGWPP